MPQTCLLPRRNSRSYRSGCRARQTLVVVGGIKARRSAAAAVVAPIILHVSHRGIVVVLECALCNQDIISVVVIELCVVNVLLGDQATQVSVQVIGVSNVGEASAAAHIPYSAYLVSQLANVRDIPIRV